MTTSEPTAGCIARPLARVVAGLLCLAALAGCAQIKSRLPQRAPAKRPPTSAPAHPPPAARPATPFPVLAPATAERDRGRMRQALAAGDKDALAPADVGYYLDVLVGRLRQDGGARLGIARHGDQLVLDLSRVVAFEPGRAQAAAGARDTLARLGRLLGEYRQLLVALRVSPVDAAANDDPALAQQRAFALAQQLADAGVARKRIVVLGGHAAGGARIELQLDPVVQGAKGGGR